MISTGIFFLNLDSGCIDGGEISLEVSEGLIFNMSSNNYPASSTAQCSWTITAGSGGFTRVEFVDHMLGQSIDSMFVRLWNSYLHKITLYDVYEGDGQTELTALTGGNVPISLISKYLYTQVIYAPYARYDNEKRLFMTISWIPDTGM